MKNKKHVSLIIGSLFLSISFYSCTKQEKSQVEVISIDVDKSQPLDISEGRLVELEATDASLLYELGNIGFLKEKIVILSREIVCVFDSNGKFLCTVGNKGQGPGEYTNLANIFIKNDRIYLLDHMSRKLLCFDENGQFVSSIQLDITEKGYAISDLFPLKNGNYVAKTMFHGDHMRVPIGSIWDKYLNFVSNVEGRSVNTGLTSHDNFSQYNDQIMYWETLNDTVFVINDYNLMTAKYYIDFGKHAISGSDRFGKNVYVLIDYLNKHGNADNIAGLVGNVFEDDEQLMFWFGFKYHTHYTIYDKANKSAQTFRFEDKNNEYNANGPCWYYQDSLYLACLPEKDFDKNPCIVVFDKKGLQNKRTTP